MEDKSLVHTAPLKDKSLWLAILVPVLVMAGKVFKLDIDAETVMSMVGPVVAFIVSSKLKQASVVKTESTSLKALEEARKLLNPEGR